MRYEISMVVKIHVIHEIWSVGSNKHQDFRQWTKDSMQTGLLSCEGYVPDKHYTIQTDSHLKQCISWELRD